MSWFLISSWVCFLSLIEGFFSLLISLRKAAERKSLSDAKCASKAMHLFKFDTSRSLSVERRSPLLWPFFTNPNPQEFNNREENKLVGKHNAWKLPKKNILFFQRKKNLVEFLASFWPILEVLFRDSRC